MQATGSVFRHRFLLHGLIYGLGFWSPWDRLLPRGSALGGHQSAWLALAAALARVTLLSFTSTTVLLLLLGILSATAAAALRTWGAASLGAFRVTASGMVGNRIVAAGPYRYMRNPLYLGTVLHTVALALLMPPTGALFVLIAIPFLQALLIAGEEQFLTASLGPSYFSYRNAVPSILPSLKPRLATAQTPGHWGPAILTESYMIGVAIAFTVLGWRYNAFLLDKGIIVALGVSIVARGFLPRRLETGPSGSKTPAPEPGN